MSESIPQQHNEFLLIHFRRNRKAVAKSDYQPRHVCPHSTAQLPPDEYSCNFMFGIFTKIGVWSLQLKQTLSSVRYAMTIYRNKDLQPRQQIRWRKHYPHYSSKQYFPHFFAREPLLASKNNYGSSHPCSRTYRVSG